MDKNCFNCKHYGQPSLAPPHRCVACMRRDEPFALWEPKPITNYDLLIHKTPEELARWIADDLIEPGYYDGDQGYELWLDWLKQEAPHVADP